MTQKNISYILIFKYVYINIFIMNFTLTDSPVCNSYLELILGMVATLSTCFAVISELIGISKCKANSISELPLMIKLNSKKNIEIELPQKKDDDEEDV